MPHFAIFFAILTSRKPGGSYYFPKRCRSRSVDVGARTSCALEDADILSAFQRMRARCPRSNVLCRMEKKRADRFGYIEVKSSPPQHIDIPEIRSFVNRVQSLRPDMAIFFEDTHLRMKDKLVVMFEEEMQRRFGKEARQHYPGQRLHDEIFSINKILFLSNTKPGLTANLRICLRHHLAGRAVQFSVEATCAVASTEN